MTIDYKFGPQEENDNCVWNCCFSCIDNLPNI